MLSGSPAAFGGTTGISFIDDKIQCKGNWDYYRGTTTTARNETNSENTTDTSQTQTLGWRDGHHRPLEESIYILDEEMSLLDSGIAWRPPQPLSLTSTPHPTTTTLEITSMPSSNNTTNPSTLNSHIFSHRHHVQWTLCEHHNMVQQQLQWMDCHTRNTTNDTALPLQGLENQVWIEQLYKCFTQTS